jgi:hypothetical protein
MPYFFCYQCGHCETVSKSTTKVEHTHLDESVSLLKFDTMTEVQLHVDKLMKDRFSYGDKKPK